MRRHRLKWAWPGFTQRDLLKASHLVIVRRPPTRGLDRGLDIKAPVEQHLHGWWWELRVHVGVTERRHHSRVVETVSRDDGIDLCGGQKSLTKGLELADVVHILVGGRHQYIHTCFGEYLLCA